MKYCVLEVHPILAVLALAASFLCLDVDAEITSGKSEKGQSYNFLPIAQVFSTKEKLWLYWQNYTDDVDLSTEFPDMKVPPLDLTQKCTFIEMDNISENDINYWWKTIMDSQMVAIHYYGQFLREDGDELGYMNVRDISGNETNPSFRMTLKHRRANCSVFFVTSIGENGETGCELYVRDKAISRNPPKECTAYYRTHCVNKTVVYEASCKRRVEKAQRKLDNIMT
uniref:Putative group v salivary lipocalin n=1 Tax=Rhipicephalus pulchellus TaxID=72859 RepID=L7LSZ0_RHIPC